MKINRFSLIVMCFCAGLLAACGGGDSSPTPTVTPEGPPSATPDPSAEPTVVSPFGTIAPVATAGPEIGVPPEMTGVDTGSQPGGVGTLVAVGTVDPELPAGFDRIILVRTGGPLDENGQSMSETIIIERNGTISRNGVAGQASATTVDSIGARVDAINIFAIQANYVGAIPREGPSDYLYQMQVEKGGSERLITAQDGLMPEAVEALVAAVLAEGLKIDVP